MEYIIHALLTLRARARALACHLNHCAVEGFFLFSKIAPTRLYTYNNRQNRKYVPRRSMLLIPALAYFNILTARRARAEYISYPCRARSYCKSATGQKRPRAFFKLLMYRFGIRYKKTRFRASVFVCSTNVTFTGNIFKRNPCSSDRRY